MLNTLDKEFVEFTHSMQLNIRTIMDEKNMTISSLSKLTNIHYGSLWKIINNPPSEVNCKLKTLFIISKKLEIDIMKLLDIKNAQT